MKKLFITLIAGVALAFLINHLFLKPQEAKKAGRKRGRGQQNISVAVETQPIKKTRLLDEGVFTGSLYAQSEFDLAPKISGRIKKLYLDIGDLIKNGEIIAELDNEELLLEVRQAEAELEIARANYNESKGLLEIAKKELERTKTMHKQKVSSDVELEKAQSEYKTRLARLKVSESQLSNRQAALERAEVRLSYAKVDASWTGGSNERFVAEKYLDEGSMAGPGSPLISVIDIATLTAIIDVVEKDYFKIKKGQLAKIRSDAIEDKTFEAKVVRIPPLLDNRSRLAKVELELKNSGFTLKPGMFVTATIVFAAHDSATIVPNHSLVRRNDKEGIFVVNEASSTVRFIAVEKGFANDSCTEIISPEVSGQVVTLGYHLLEDGASIRISNLKSGKSGAEL
ncbi:MAG: efflux RND transporter periplasmic adaptor subunit [Candidatus Rifleibacteriota bacterium]